jgi:3-deoxy-D-manno-octulosonic-acid transferase
MDPEKITVTGSIKFDTQIPGDLEDKSQGLKRLLGLERLIWIAGSTHEGEEEQVLDAFAKVREAIPRLLLILVPRHPERFNKVAALCKKRGYKIVLRTHHQACDNTTDIFIGDTMGELMLFYNCADIAFVGGSLVSIGGHNLLEPAALAKPSITGPHMRNFLEITQLLLAATAIKQIQNSDELAEAVVNFANNKELRKLMGANGFRVVRDNSGALAKHLQIMRNLIALDISSEK